MRVLNGSDNDGEMSIAALTMKSIRQKGLFRTMRIVISHIQDLAFDFRYRTDTMRWTGLKDLDVLGGNKEHGVHYQPTQARKLRELFKKLALPTTYPFLDLGCGKGRVLMLAAEHGFRQLIGVDFSQDLCRVATSNLSRYLKKSRSVADYQIVHADAATYTISDSVCTIFMNNPFDAVVMRPVIELIKDSLKRHPRKIYIIYVHPLCRYLFDNSEMFAVIAQHRFPQCEFLVYTAGDG